MKKLIAIVALLGLVPVLAMAGFPYHTNSVTLTPGSINEDYNNFNWSFSGYDDEVFNIRWKGVCSNAVMRFSYPKAGTVYLQWTNITVGTGKTNFVTTILRTNLTLSVNTYYVEVLGYSSSDFTQTPTRLLGKGKANMHWSIFNNNTFVTNRYSPAGDITAVLAGTNLLGGGTGGAVTLNVNMANVGSSANVTAVSNLAVAARSSALAGNATGAVLTAGQTALNLATNLLEGDVNLLKTRVDAGSSANVTAVSNLAVAARSSALAGNATGAVLTAGQTALNLATNLLEGDVNLLKTRVDAAAVTNGNNTGTLGTKMAMTNGYSSSQHLLNPSVLSDFYISNQWLRLNEFYGDPVPSGNWKIGQPAGSENVFFTNTSATATWYVYLGPTRFLQYDRFGMILDAGANNAIWMSKKSTAVQWAVTNKTFYFKSMPKVVTTNLADQSWVTNQTHTFLVGQRFNILPTFSGTGLVDKTFLNGITNLNLAAWKAYTVAATNLLEGDVNLLKTRVDAAAVTNASQSVSNIAQQGQINGLINGSNAWEAVANGAPYVRMTNGIARNMTASGPNTRIEKLRVGPATNTTESVSSQIPSGVTAYVYSRDTNNVLRLKVGRENVAPGKAMTNFIESVSADGEVAQLYHVNGGPYWRINRGLQFETSPTPTDTIEGFVETDNEMDSGQTVVPSCAAVKYYSDLSNNATLTAAKTWVTNQTHTFLVGQRFNILPTFSGTGLVDKTFLNGITNLNLAAWKAYTVAATNGVVHDSRELGGTAAASYALDSEVGAATNALSSEYIHWNIAATNADYNITLMGPWDEARTINKISYVTRGGTGALWTVMLASNATWTTWTHGTNILAVTGTYKQLLAAGLTDSTIAAGQRLGLVYRGGNCTNIAGRIKLTW